MSLTEIVLELEPRDHPLSRITADRGDVRAVWRIVDPGLAGPRFRTCLTLLGPPDATAEAAEALARRAPRTGIEILQEGPDAEVLCLEEPLGNGTPGHPVADLLEVLGPHTFLDPIYVRDGALRVRALVAQELTTQDAMERLQELRSRGPWDGFRVVRMSGFDGRRYTEGLRRVLTPDQENLLRLAVDMGYYRSPKECTLEDIGDAVGLTASPVHKRLKAVEHRLVHAHLDPESVDYPAMDGRSAPWDRLPEEREGSMLEGVARIRWPGFPLAGFSSDHPGNQVVLHHFYDTPRSETVASLVVTTAPPGAREDLEAALRSFAGVREVEVLADEEDHVAFQTEAEAGQGPWHASSHPFLQAVGECEGEVFLHPLVMEDGDIWVKGVTAGQRDLDRDRMEELMAERAEEVGWEDWDLVYLRSVEGDPAMEPLGTSRDLTPRQEEVLRIAHALGYFETPRDCTLEDVARTLGVSANAVHKNLTAAERKIIRGYLGASA